MNSKQAFQLVSNKLRNTNRWFEYELKLIQQDLDRLEQVIKIFKSFKIILKDDGNELYTLKFAFDIYGLTPEEYNLLKEILKDD